MNVYTSEHWKDGNIKHQSVFFIVVSIKIWERAEWNYNESYLAFPGIHNIDNLTSGLLLHC